MEKKSSCMRKRDGKKPQGFVDVSYQWRYWSTPRLAANIFFQPVAILFSISNTSGLYRNHGMRENPLFTAQLMLNFSRSKLWRSNAIIIFSTTNTVFLDYRSLLLMSKKIRSFRKRNPAKERKKDKRRLHEEKGEKSHKDLYVSYHTIDELSLAANIFSITANFTSLHCSNYHDVQKITILPQTESRKGKEKKQIFCLPHWARSLHPQDSRLLDIEFLRSDLFFFFFTTISQLPPVLLHKTVGTWNLEWGSVLQQNVTSRTDGREDIVNLYIYRCQRLTKT